MTDTSCSIIRRWLLMNWVLMAGGLMLLATPCEAHPADISYLRVKVERQRLEFRFSFNLLTLGRFVEGLDANQDHALHQQEIEAALPRLGSFLQEKVPVKINGMKASLGRMEAPQYLWPSENGVFLAAERDYPVRHLDLTFHQEVKPLLAEVWLGFDLWEQVGPLGTVEATFEQDDFRTQVPFSLSEPDYLYDTGYAVEHVFEPASAVPEGRPSLAMLGGVGAGVFVSGVLMFWHRRKRRKGLKVG